MTLGEAKAAFLATCAACGVVPSRIKEEPGKIYFVLPFKRENHELLREVANVEDLRGDPPDSYILEERHAPKGEYVKTGCYND